MEINVQKETEEKRIRKKVSLESSICPICSCTIRGEDKLQIHFKLELEKLDKIKKISNKSTSSTPPSTSKAKVDEANTSNENETWSTFQKIKENRVRRTTRVSFGFFKFIPSFLINLQFQQLKNRKRKAEDQTCPICSKVVIEDLQLHVELCLKSQQNSNSSDESEAEIDVGESYSWCGQTRIRATTLIDGTLSSAGVGTILTKVNEDEDSEVNIDGDDDTQVYGTSQYSERDVVLLNSNNDDRRLRDLVIGETPSTSIETREENNQNFANNASRSGTPEKMEVEDEKSSHEIVTNDQSSQQIIESLKSRIREYEKFIKNKPKCLICLDDFKKPVVSICCWHVHCEECWLYTLGCRKLCPQCNMITTASDLRRIYL
jgi:hypothetical protein